MRPETSEPEAPRRGVGPAAVGLLFAALTALVTGVHFSGGLFCSLERTNGANIDHALGLVLASGLLGLPVLLLTRKRKGPRIAVLLIEAALLVVAMELVALDSARYTAQRSCDFITTSETAIDEHVYYLFVLWGLPVALLLWTALPDLGGRTRRQIVAVGLVAAAVAVGALVTAESGAPSPHSRHTIPLGTKILAEPNHDHVEGKVRYNRTPPAGGPHNDVWLNCGVYTTPVRNENAVHSLEHGAVWITYAPNLGRPSVTRLRHFVESHYRGPQRYLILSPYPRLRRPVVASAWGAQLMLKGATDPRLAKFVAYFAGGGQGGEPGGYCTDGIGSPAG